MKNCSKNLYKNSLYLLAENKLGVLERIIGVFTLRGFKLENLVYSQNKNPELVDIKVTIDCSDQDLEKLVKILHNQISVLEIRLMIDEMCKENSYIAIAS